MIKELEIADPDSCLNRAEPGEYVFSILARDPAYPAAIVAWAAERVALGKNRIDDDQIRRALDSVKDASTFRIRRQMRDGWPILLPEVPSFHAPEKLFTHLMELPWLEATEARKEYFMADRHLEYTYGKGENARTYRAEPYTTDVSVVRRSLELTGYGPDYNVCFLNRYDNERNALGWHADDSPEMDPAHPIAVVSYGAEREIWVRPNGYSGVIPPSWRFKLTSGSVFVMPPGFQESHQHRIPKHDRPCGPRVSLTFRRYKLPEAG